MKRDVYVIADESRLLVRTFIKTLEPLEREIHIIPPDIVDIANLPKEPINLILFLGENIKFQIIQAASMMQKEFNMHLYIIGEPRRLSLKDQEFYNTIPSTRFLSLSFDPNKLYSVMENNENEKKKILVVDDEPIFLRNVKGWLEETFEVSLVSSGDMAMEFLDMHPIDLVILDYKMPSMDGPEVLRRIRADKRIDRLPVIFLTANNDREMVRAAMNYRPDGYILKTLPPESIKKAVVDFFKNRVEIYP
ncbi:MAG: response regulator transcription factor [Treponema sp.]|nr:response regulator transcription factor [Treponema sp.]